MADATVAERRAAADYELCMHEVTRLRAEVQTLMAEVHRLMARVTQLEGERTH